MKVELFIGTGVEQSIASDVNNVITCDNGIITVDSVDISVDTQ
jgi:single-stranded DNA-specific DHH superfamily exonuclease